MEPRQDTICCLVDQADFRGSIRCAKGLLAQITSHIRRRPRSYRPSFLASAGDSLVSLPRRERFHGGSGGARLALIRLKHEGLRAGEADCQQQKVSLLKIVQRYLYREPGKKRERQKAPAKSQSSPDLWNLTASWWRARHRRVLASGTEPVAPRNNLNRFSNERQT